MLRLLLYVCFLTLTVRLAWPLVDAGWTRTRATPGPSAPLREAPPPAGAPDEPAVQIEDPVNI